MGLFDFSRCIRLYTRSAKIYLVLWQSIALLILAPLQQQQHTPGQGRRRRTGGERAMKRERNVCTRETEMKAQLKGKLIEQQKTSKGIQSCFRDHPPPLFPLEKNRRKNTRNVVMMMLRTPNKKTAETCHCELLGKGPEDLRQNPHHPLIKELTTSSSTSPASQDLWLKNQLERLFELPSEAPSWLCILLATEGATEGPSPGVLALGPPPPRRGLAMRPKGLLAKLPWAGAGPPPRPRVEPCFAASRRSLTARSWDSNLGEG